VFTAPFPKNRRPIVERVSLRGNAFTESLPSNGYARHNIVTILGCSLYCLGADPTGNNALNGSFIVVGVFTEPLPRNAFCSFAYCTATAVLVVCF
jgi:hypothetical protein